MKLIEITPFEALAIDFCCKNEILSQDVFLQLGQVLLNEKPMKLSISEGELWQIRQSIPLGLAIGGENVCVTIKMKIYKCLLDADTERVLGIPVGEIQEIEATRQTIDFALSLEEKEAEGEDGLCAA